MDWRVCLAFNYGLWLTKIKLLCLNSLKECALYVHGDYPWNKIGFIIYMYIRSIQYLILKDNVKIYNIIIFSFLKAQNLIVNVLFKIYRNVWKVNNCQSCVAAVSSIGISRWRLFIIVILSLSFCTSSFLLISIIYTFRLKAHKAVNSTQMH